MDDRSAVDRDSPAAPSTTSSEVVFGEFTGRQAPKEFCADAPDRIAESECHMRAGATTVADRS